MTLTNEKGKEIGHQRWENGHSDKELVYLLKIVKQSHLQEEKINVGAAAIFDLICANFELVWRFCTVNTLAKL